MNPAFAYLHTSIMRRLPLWARIGFLVGAAVAPILGFSLFMVYTDYQDQRQDASQQALNIARSLALAVDNELHTRIATLEILAMSRALAAGDLVTFRSEAETLVARQSAGANIVLLREDGQQLMNTASPPGEPLPVRRQLENQRRVFATGLPSVSDVYNGLVVKHPVVAIEVPVRRPDGSVGLVLALNPTFEAFASVIQSQNPAEGWIIAVLDRAGVRIARLPTDDRLIGQPALPDFLAAWSAHSEAVVEAISPDGEPVLAAFSKLAYAGWGVSVAIPEAQLTGRASRNAITAATVGLIVFALGIWLTYWFARSVIGPISALRRFAVNSHDAGAEPGTAVVKTGLAEVDEVADVLRTGVRRARATQLSLDLALEQSADAQAQRDLLLREVYHRVKNNLQIVDALLSMQGRQLSGNEATLALTALRGRIQVLGLVHEQLMKSGDLVTFDIAPFLDELCRNIVASGADRTVRLSVDAMPLLVTLDFAIPVGLVVTELVTNCLQHAFRQDNGRVSVILHRNTVSDVVLIVSDDGGASVCPGAEQERLGMKIIRGLVGQLDGVMKVSHDDGRRTEILLTS